MMHILAIDTSANFVTCGIVAVQPNGYPTVVASVETDNARGHMELLVPQIQQCLQQANIEPHHLHAVVVGVGPGPFTGLRVGMATGMAYADALGVPVHGVSSLEATAWSAVVNRSFIAGQSLDITVIADARRSEWYAARYRFSAPRNGAVGITRATVLAPHVDRPEAVVATLANEPAEPAEDHLVRAGAGVQTTVEAHLQEALPNLPVAEGHPTVAGLVMAALHQEHGFMGLLRTPQPVRAHYLRRPDAVVPKLPNTSAALDMAAVAQQDLAALQRFDVEGDGGGAEPLPQLTGCYVAPLGFEHVDAVAALERSIFAEESPWTSDMIAQGIATPYVSALGVFEDGNLLGYAFHSMLGHISEPECELQNIAIDPAHRGRGLAHLLLEPLIEIADRTGATCFLEVRTDNTPAIALYERYGFTIIDTRTNYYQPSGADAYIMKRPTLQQPRNVAEVASDTQLDTQHDESAQPQLILGIESSCDETGVGIINRGDYTVLADAVASSMNEHARFGGVVPEIASRAHLESMQPVMRAALEEASIAKPDAVAATIGPGLAGALLVGAAAAKAYAAAWEVPFYAVNHLGGHVAVDTLVEGVTADKLDNAIALLVSGGHTQILHVQGVGKPMREMGSTLDDAAGEAYDKVARLLGLGYPGGPIIDQLAAKGDATAIRFPRGMMRQQDARYDFSFSGVKTAVARFVEAAERAGETIKIEDVCASFQEAVVEVLVVKALRACADTGASVLLLGGGVSANRRLREFAAQACEAAGVELHVPPLRLCTDNGVMIAALAAHLIDAGHEASDLSVATDPALEVEVPLV